jgi:hypothetical protein
MQSPEDIRTTHAALFNAPVEDRLSALMVSLIEGNPGAANGVCALINAAGIMARLLPPAERLAIAWMMLEELERINAKWN